MFIKRECFLFGGVWSFFSNKALLEEKVIVFSGYGFHLFGKSLCWLFPPFFCFPFFLLIDYHDLGKILSKKKKIFDLNFKKGFKGWVGAAASTRQSSLFIYLLGGRVWG